MRKLISIFLFIMFSTKLFANIFCINFDTLQTYPSIRTDIAFVQENYQFMNSWTPSWDFPIRKDKVLRNLQTTSDKVEKLLPSNIDNIDLHLFLLTVYQYRYNLEDHDVRESFNKLIERTITKFNDDYRPIWLKAEFSANSSNLKEAISEYQQFIQRKEDLDFIHPLALFDYASTCAMSGMYRTASICFKEYAKKYNIKIDTIPLYQATEKTLIPTITNSTYEPNQIWNLDQEGKSNIFSSRVWGTRLKTPKDWSFRFSKYIEGKSVLMLTPPSVKSKQNNSITANVAIDYSVQTGTFEKYIETYISTKNKSIIYSKPISVRRKDKEYIIYTLTDPNLYPNNGGMLGYMIFTSNAYSERSGFNLEIPANLPPETGLNYFRANPQLDRIKSNVHVAIVIDSCKEIAEETHSIYEELLRNIEF